MISSNGKYTKDQSYPKVSSPVLQQYVMKHIWIYNGLKPSTYARFANTTDFGKFTVKEIIYFNSENKKIKPE